ncbi:hypothetical protein OS493_032378 [Desmophyllum pertusum]|uniref:Uncharacterized protein n=1 Tax=Desmophyllum pertusum TaxID=174260 RepID=A0A9X0CJU4_9CNID|nr:hypothetical protein OS493_032378 [Desmophyllum pertusum]
MEWDKISSEIWALNKKVIDPIAPRYTALRKNEAVPVFIPDSERLFVASQGEDAVTLSEGEMVTLMNWGNAKITKINKTPSGGVKSVEAQLHLDNKDFKKTTKLTWIAESAKAPLLPTIAVQFDDVISKPVLTKNDDFKNYINKDSKHETEMLGDPAMAALKKGDVIQLQRRGYFKSVHWDGRESPCILFSVPDGHTKPSPTGGAKTKVSRSC